jgi:heat-inducible transcriptional repressor
MASDKPRDVLDERAQILLRLLVEQYIREGQPVGSRTLSREPGLDLSPATIRNIVSDLEELGFVKSPHTSAGRVPTIKGYRFFVDTLIKLTPPKGEELLRFSESMSDASGDPQALALSVSNLLSAVTSLAGIVTVPRRAQTALRQIEFLPLSGHRVLAILVVNDREVQNKILNVSRDFGADELKRASNYLNAHSAAAACRMARDLLLAELKRTRASMNALMVEAIEMAQQVFPEAEPAPEFVVAGETNLMGLNQVANVETLKGLFEAFGRQRDILHLLDQSMKADGVQIFIGHESGYELLDSYSIVAAPYTTEDDTMGVLGVIGPTRMAYERVIPIVDITAKLLGRALKSRLSPTAKPIRRPRRGRPGRHERKTRRTIPAPSRRGPVRSSKRCGEADEHRTVTSGRRRSRQPRKRSARELDAARKSARRLPKRSCPFAKPVGRQPKSLPDGPLTAARHARSFDEAPARAAARSIPSASR